MGVFINGGSRHYSIFQIEVTSFFVSTTIRSEIGLIHQLSYIRGFESHGGIPLDGNGKSESKLDDYLGYPYDFGHHEMGDLSRALVRHG